MKHLDLYSGAGCFALAAEYVWGNDYNLHAFVEIEPFAQRWLKANWPGCKIHGDADAYEHDGTPIDLISGGPPCQSISVAGKGKGSTDDRWQWPTMFRIIQDVRPKFIIFENVYNLINFERGVLFDGILSDMESAGYETSSFVLPACAVDAPHLRNRVFVVANAKERSRGLPIRPKGGEVVKSKWSSQGDLWESRSVELNINSWDTSEWLRCHDNKLRRIPGAQSGIRLLVDGYPNRNDLLRLFGNAIVPQVVIPIMKAIKQHEN